MPDEGFHIKRCTEDGVCIIRSQRSFDDSCEMVLLNREVGRNVVRSRCIAAISCLVSSSTDSQLRAGDGLSHDSVGDYLVQVRGKVAYQALGWARRETVTGLTLRLPRVELPPCHNHNASAHLFVSMFPFLIASC